MELLEQLKNKYENAAKEYGAKFFNMEKLNERITHMKESGLSLQSFLEQEMEFFMQTEALAKKKHEDSKKKEEFNQKVDNIIVENENLIKKYPDVYFDAAASVEIRRLAGAIRVWKTEYYPVIEYIFKVTNKWNDIQDLESDLDRLSCSDNNDPSLLLKHYIEEIQNKGENSRAGIERKLLQTAALSLFKMKKVIEKENKYRVETSTDGTIRLFGLSKEVEEKWNHVKESKALLMLIDFITGVLNDFRILDMANHAYRLQKGNNQT